MVVTPDVLNGARYAPAVTRTSDKVAMMINNEQAHGNTFSSVFRGDDTKAKIQCALVEAVRGFQRYGHEFADLDPLRLPPSLQHLPAGRYIDGPSMRSSSDILTALNLREDELDVPLTADLGLECGGMLGKEGALVGKTVRSILTELNNIYSGSIGYEFSHIQNPEKVRFFVDALEGKDSLDYEVTDMERVDLLHRVAEAQLFEQFFQSKAPTTKRFGADGIEAVVPFLQTLCARSNADHCIVGMAHRGRLNILTNVFHKPMRAVMREFKGLTGIGGQEYGNSGDVKYHLGVEHVKEAQNGKKIRFSLLCNPSHLEAVGPAVVGRTRAAQDRLCGESGISQAQARSKVLPISIHGDAAFAGQGVVYETFQMMNLDGYSVGGTVHVVLNNQIGFTTNNREGISSRAGTDIAKAFDIPVIHVNADDITAVEKAARLAADYRARFQSDVVVDIVGYRRNGHNEQDMAAFTQPAMFQAIQEKPRVLEIYSKELQRQGLVDEETVASLSQEITDRMLIDYKEANQGAIEDENYQHSHLWGKMAVPTDFRHGQVTGVVPKLLRELLCKLSKLPETFNAHPNIAKIYKARAGMSETGKNIDFGTAECVAFASLLKEGYNVRLTGQDARRGTFSHRHAVVHDQIDFSKFTPLSQLRSLNPSAFQVVNSLLSEYGALSFEVGYSSHHPDTLTIWEAQFGDFVNGAQIVIDQFISSQETKWNQQTGIVLYLPHGYDGMGPDHSSARLERFLQLCDNREDVISSSYFDDSKTRVVQTSNMQVICPTTASNLFHALRRQMKRGFRKPLIVFQSKRLLKSKEAFSTSEEFEGDKKFVAFYRDQGVNDVSKVRRLILCSGQVYYDLVKQRKNNKLEQTIAIARIEQLCPLPYGEMATEIERFANLEDVVWAQEEPMNSGAWSYMGPRLQTVLRHVKHKIKCPIYIGRDISASTAVGCPKIHKAESEKLLSEAMELEQKHNSISEYFTLDDKKVTRKPTVSEESYVRMIPSQ